MKIGFFNIRSKEEQEFFQKKLPNHTLVFSSNSVVSSNEDYEILSIFAESKIDPKILSSYPTLKFISTRSTGFDHIDLAACEKKGITVSNVPAYGEATVAEFTFALILTLAKKIPQAITGVKKTEKFEKLGLTGIDLKGKTIGVIGTGHIGSHVIQMAKGFEMKVLAFDAYPNSKLAQDLKFEYLPLEELFSKSDIITFHVPSLPSTKHMLNQKNISKVKKGAILINTSRGEVLETQSLVKALEDNIISEAALDVLENEDALKNTKDQTKEELEISKLNSKLINMENVFITPHNASNTKEATERIWQTSVENIKSFIEKNPKNLVKLKNS